MKSLHVAMLLGCCMAVAACAPMARKDAGVTTPAEVAERQILVMLRAAPPHFRPDTAYAPGYEAQTRLGGQRRVAENLARRHGLAVIDAWPMPVLGIDCFVMEAEVGRAVARVVDDIGHDPGVESAQAMNVFRVLGHDDPLYPLQPSARLWHLAEVHKFATGKNVRVAEVDTGVEADHPDLRGRVAVARNFVESPARGGEAHGTAVAGIIAARADDHIGIAGIAPEARLYALRACVQPAGQIVATCTSFTLAKALQFALDQDVQVINLSLGGPRDRLLERLLDVGLQRNIVIVGAADPRAAGGGFPAAHPGVLAVAAEMSGNLPASALLAPGTDVPATTPGQEWGFVTGSSYAAAHISGVAALLLEHAPALGGAQIRGALASNSVSGAVLGRPAMVDVCSAVARLASACVCGCVVGRDAKPVAAN